MLNIKSINNSLPSVLTLNKNRSNHLAKLIDGLNRSTIFPKELIIVEMSDTPVTFTSPNFSIQSITLKTNQLPLAKARNLAAQTATSDKLLFLDVDCIAAHNFVENMSNALNKYKGLITCNVYYLPGNFINYNENYLPLEEKMLKIGKPSPYRKFINNKYIEGSFQNFWSLAFAIKKNIFDNIGGFSEDFIGYGGEDTEFAYKAIKKDYKHYLGGFIGAFHQYHDIDNFPYCKFSDIIQNAQIFYNKWGIWCMNGWLETFQKEGYIIWNKNNIEILKYPNLNKHN